MPFKQHVTEDLRLVILRLLNEAAGYDLNTSIIQSAVKQFGHSVSRDSLHTQVQWLAEQGLVAYTEITSVWVVKLTQRGVDVVDGSIAVHGVKRPSPSDL